MSWKPTLAHLNILAHDMINLLYYEYWTDKQKCLYVWKKYGLAEHFLYRFIKSWKSISNEWLDPICRSSCLFGDCIIK